MAINVDARAWLGVPASDEHGGSTPGGLQATLQIWGLYSMAFVPGAIAGGALGWFTIQPVNWALGRVFQGFNWLFDRSTQAYGRTVGWSLRLSAIVLLIYVGLIGLTGFGFTRVPGGFVPNQDKGYLLVNVQLPDSASLERTAEATEKVEQIALETPGVAHTVSIPGQSFVLNASQLELRLNVRNSKPFHDRQSARS